jgi:hypothetical protein
MDHCCDGGQVNAPRAERKNAITDSDPRIGSSRKDLFGQQLATEVLDQCKIRESAADIDA